MTHEQLLAHGEFLQRLARRLVPDAQAADDLVQSTWLSAMEANPKEVRSPRAWLKTIALNLVRGEHRREAIRERIPAREPRGELDPADLYLREQTTRQLIDAVFALPEGERDVVLRRFFDGLNPLQIARATGVPHETVRTRLRRALERLRTRLDAEYGGDRRAWVLALSPLAGLPAPSAPATETATAATKQTFFLSLGGTKALTLVSLTLIALVGFFVLTGEEQDPLDVDRVADATIASTERRASRELSAAPTDREGNAIAPRPVVPENPVATPETAAPADEEILCDVYGRAIDRQGQPVVGARIELCSTNGPTKRIAETYTDADGHFRFGEREVPPQKAGRDFGTVIVFGTAAGHGFAWHGMRMMNRGRRPAEERIEDDDSFYRGEECVMNLVFPPSRTVEGLVVDETGTPVPDVEVDLVGCDFIDREGLHPHVNYREFWGLDYLPEDRRRTRSDANGRFRLHDLPSEMLLNLSFRHPERAGRSCMVVTTDRDPKTLDLEPNVVDRDDVIIERSPLEVVMPSTRRVTVFCRHAASQAPIAGAKVHAYRLGTDRQSAYGPTDAQGEVVLRIPTGRFRLSVDPPEGTEIVPALREIEILEAPRAQEIIVDLDTGAIVVFEARDARTGQPLPGVSFARGPVEGMQEIQSRPTIIDHPTTDAKGRLRVLMRPGRTQLRLGWSLPAGYAWSREGQEVELRSGETHTLRFELTPQGR